ncbi:hypothetical protein RT723_14235 [Psychrosphaera aquimarina]|uniref:Uncharacterized protein n=1 Tax=Psychrosphaera aquimarina TaxID=2044854 RepID=A0ABU3R378_9GAMM|nr:hypothetical protein [Psychrosphaera aquimarina]MDU0114129.1 hypothetical protein [Psychrosphaera aquimarina]
MLLLSILLMIVSFFLYMTVVIDMFKKKTWLGFLGLFLFPFTFYHAFKNYSGNRKRISWLLVITCVFPFSYIQYELSVGDKELSPFFAKAQEINSMSCVKGSTVSTNAGRTFYQVWCNPENLNDVNYTNESELVSGYKDAFVIPMLTSYKETFGLIEDKGIVLGIASPSELYACYKIENPGKIVKSWSSFEACG